MSLRSSYPVGRSSVVSTLPTPTAVRPMPPGRVAAPLGLRLLGAAVCFLLALGLTGVLFVWTYPGQWVDGLLLPRAERGGGYEQQTDLVEPAKAVLATFGDPFLLAALLGGLLLVGLLGRRLLAGVVGAALVVGAVLVSGAAKSALPRPDLAIQSSTTHNSFPSGHVAVAAALLLAYMLVLPGWARRWLALPGTAGVSVIGAATMIAGWHRFSDVLGGVLLSATLFCLAAAALAARPGGTALRSPDRLDGGGVAGRLAEGAVGLVVLVWASMAVAPDLAASVRRGPLLAIVAALGLTMLVVGAAVFLVRSADFAAAARPPTHPPGARSARRTTGTLASAPPDMTHTDIGD
ncbi:phosphatase PAP2 family protein [Micromonospora sp. NPDC000316]|uniref:phosphatase PAP2 family protein n=1 Tax=Micromonospora sp. NPDC000316 TaxID=3364216 RepID=UPI0036C37F5E